MIIARKRHNCPERHRLLRLRIGPRSRIEVTNWKDYGVEPDVRDTGSGRDAEDKEDPAKHLSQPDSDG